MSRIKHLLTKAYQRLETPIMRGIVAWVLLPLIMIKVGDASQELVLATKDLIRQDGWSAWPYVMGCVAVVAITKGVHWVVRVLKSQYPLIRL
jgi:hypothetical protein